MSLPTAVLPVRPWLAGLLLVTLVSLLIPSLGCSDKGSGPKMGPLSAEEQKQLQELQEQRVDEWGRKVK